jgi:hypothetical protein
MDTDSADSEAPSLIPLTPEQVRVLGCLLEKEATTPEAYPLTLNSLITACNQTTNRDPIVRYDEATVTEALDGLKRRGYVLQLTLSGARVQKYKHTLDTKFGFLTKPTMAIIAVLLLRGLQTSGELRQRTERLHAFLDIPSVEHSLQKLMEYPGTPLVVHFPSGYGRKAPTYAHLLSGPVDPGSQGPTTPAGTGAGVVDSPREAGWRERIEQELATLKAEVADLRAQLQGGSIDAPAPDSTETGGSPESGSVYIP